ncbi:MAG: alcohol dehydrogenase catalytic domain-containing protein [Lachnospiraceae bacterium]|nr:alcohol dehydrogenase catalytic domain-containing protein [Lachnospiraceae bacterium]
MKTMKALVYDKPGRKYSGIREVPYPVCGSDEVIIKVMSASICKGVEHDHDQEGVGTDLAVYPVTPGHEFSGVIEEVGSNVTRFKKGDRVCADNTEYCEDCYYCRKEQSNYCPTFGSLGHNINGGFAEYVRVKKEKVFPIPDSLSFNSAALGEPVACCIHCVDRCNINFGDDVLVMGAGSMGLILAQLLTKSGARKVVAIASTKSKLDILESKGIETVVMDRSDYSVHTNKLKEICPMGFDVVVDATGSVQMIQHGMTLLKKGGKLVQYALVHSKEQLTIDPRLMFNNELTYMTSFCQSHNFGRAVEALADKTVDGDLLVTHEYPLDRFYEALDENVNNRNSVKVVIHPNQE